jgi:hypothetical protein
VGHEKIHDRLVGGFNMLNYQEWDYWDLIVVIIARIMVIDG